MSDELVIRTSSAEREALEAAAKAVPSIYKLSLVDLLCQPMGVA